ncbi:MAG TPA: ATP-binding cassette domain-containing protein, partial [Ktedonobacteraceae bacterium]|nr:ATP-binding cassette domain-containing protein [Ktedonobacteraceae bacterium]
MHVRLEKVLKQYDSVDQVTLTGYKGPPALDRIDLDIQDGEAMSIVGPSGCGKSTLLKVVAGLEFP